MLKGAETDSIHFRPYDSSIGWHGIRFFDTQTNSKPPSLLKYCDISGGLAFDDFSGGLDEWGGAIMCYNSSDVEISNTTIHDNRAFGSGLGGGIYCYGSDITIDSVNLYDNYAGYAGGGIYLDDSDPVISRTIIAGNSASTSGAGIHIEENSSPDITNVTITENYGALQGGGIFIFNTTPTIKNTIVWNNENGNIGVMGTNSFSVTYSCIEGGWPETTNVDLDPLFADPSNYDFSITWKNYPKPDTTRSSAVDMGDPSSPSDPDGTRADIGAISFEQTYTTIPGGNISGTISCAGSPYKVFGNLTVQSGDELIIEPCVYLIFEGDYYLEVKGRLLAEGTEEDNITFYPSDWITGWQGIRFHDLNSNGQDSSKMVQCHILDGNADGYNYLSYGGAINASQSSKLLIDECYFSSNQAKFSGGAIYLTQSSPDIRNSVFEGNYALNGGGIGCYDNVNTSFLNCYFANNVATYGGAIAASSCGPDFSGSTITDNHALKFGGGIYRDGGQAITFDETNRCNIYNNYANYAGLDYYSAQDVYIPPVTEVYLDTASVEQYNEHFAYPFHLFNVTSNYAKFIQEDNDLYVSTSGSDSNTGTSASDPLKTIKMALIKIIADSINPKTIHLAEGTYSPVVNSETLPINLKSYVTLSGESRANTIIDGFHIYSLMVSYGDKYDSVAKLTLQQGYKYGDGGAVVIENNSSPVFHDITLQNNYSTHDGGAIWCFDDCSPFFSYVSFINNSSNNAAGAIMCHSNDLLTMDSVLFQSNESRYSGGALQVDYTDECKFYRCSFVNNSLINGGGGGATLRQVLVNADSLTFTGNHVIGDGGAIWGYGATLNINNSTFASNSASGTGGAIGFYAGVHINMKNVVFGWNTSIEGGAIRGYYGSTVNIFNGLFLNNNTLYDPYSNGDGGAMRLNDVATNLTNVTLSGNVADGDGGGLYFWASSGSIDYTVQNSIIHGNSPDQVFVDYAATVDVDYCNIEGGWPSGTGNINLSPDFTDPGSGDYTLNPTSPCINAGNPDITGLSLPLFDLAGDPRISLDTIDMGAYEFFGGIELELKAFLEGPYNGTTMKTDLTNSTNFPSQQPYNSSPWNYSGVEEVTTLPLDNIVDWILVEVRDTSDVTLATPESIVGQQVVFLLDDGSLVDINGNNIKFGNPIDHQCFITLFHRNHLGVISAYPLTETGGVYTFDFTTPVGQGYGTDAQKNLGGGIYGMYGGNGNADGYIDMDDKTSIWSIEAGTSGYMNGDFNMDSQTDNADKNDIWINNYGNSSQIPD